MKKYLLLPFLVLSVLVAKAQDPYYSQYFMSPMTTNPALIGKGVSDMRVMSNFRSQTWGGAGAIAFKTTSVSFESRVGEKRFPDDEMAVGISMVNDASNGGLLKKNFISLGMAFNKRLSKYSTFGVGIAANYANMLLDQTQFTFQNQFGSLGFIRTLPTYDPLLVTNRTYFNADAGIHYSYVDSVWGFNLGTSIYHAAQNKQGLYEKSSFTFPKRYSTRVSAFRKFKGGDELHFTAGYDKQFSNEVFTFGTIYKLKIPGEHPINKISFGLFDRVNDSFYPFVGLESSTWAAGFSYDIVNSDVRTKYNSVQSLEASFAWQFASKNKKKKPTHDRMFIY